MTLKKLDELYLAYNRFEYIHPDPLEFLYRFETREEREIAGLVAAGLAYGKVAQILKSVAQVLEVMGDSPLAYVTERSPDGIHRDFKDFKYRFTKGWHLANLICTAKELLKTYGSLERCFLAGYREKDETVLSAMDAFISRLSGGEDTGYLTAHPAKGSACKRNNLYLRWMIRSDEVDPGGWTGIPPEKLIVPLDTHMHRIGLMMGFTQRKQANMKTALEVTRGFRNINPGDPVKYDFALTRFGIRNELSIESLGLKPGGIL